MQPSYSLKDVSLLSELEPEGLSALEEAVTTRFYKKGSIVVSQGDETDSLYLIVSGLVRVYVSDDQGKEVTLNTLKPGDSFGELALLSDRPRSASVLTLEDSKFSVITKDDFVTCMMNNAGISRTIIKHLIDRVLELTDEVSSLALLDVYGRVRRLLIKDAVEKDGKLCSRRITHQAMATRVGSSREMVSKIISDLSHGGYITVDKKTIIIEKELPSGW